MKRLFVLSAAAALLIWSTALSAAAQEEEEAPPPDSISVTTPYASVAVEPGQDASFNLDIVGPPGERVALGTSGVPSDWTARFRGGTLAVSEIILDSNGESSNLRLEVEVPAETAEGPYSLSVTAAGASGSDVLALDIEVALAVGGQVSLTSEFPALRGPADVTFSYTLELANDTAEEVTFGLQTSGPPGWQIEARPAGESRASTVTLQSGDTSRITVDVDPADQTPAGVYQVLVGAAGGGHTTETQLLTEITGNFSVELATADQRLNVTAVAGEESALPLVVFNSGTAPLLDVSLRDTAPRGWEVTYVPESIDVIEPGGFAEVTASIVPVDNAVAGDYRITFTASVPETRDSIEVRATVETSLFWGIVGVGIIVLVLVGLAFVFRRYGRR